MTEGMKTSEFYLAVASLVMGIAMLVTGLWKGDKELMDRGTQLIMAAVASYSVARGLKKLTVPGTASESNADVVANVKGK